MKHLNEQTRGIAESISEASRMKGIQWNRVTWYSWWLAIVLFCFVIPALAFYIGVEYQKTVQVLESSGLLDN